MINSIVNQHLILFFINIYKKKILYVKISSKSFEKKKSLFFGVFSFQGVDKKKISIWLIILVTKVAGFSGFRIRFSKFQKMVLFWHFDVCFLAKMV